MARVGKAWWVLALLLCGCPPADPDPPVPPVEDAGTTSCGIPVSGDLSKDIVIVPVQLNAANELEEIQAGDELAVILPPQGGRVAFVGVRATNLDPCEVQLKGVITDPLSKKVQFDTRIVNLLPDGDWVTSNELDIASFSNVPLCPNQWSDQDVFDAEYELTIAITDNVGRKAETVFNVTPVCAEPGNEGQCKCICQQGYMLGQMCE